MHQAGKLYIKCILSSDLDISNFIMTYKARSEFGLLRLLGVPPWTSGVGRRGLWLPPCTLLFPLLAPSCTARGVPWMHMVTLPTHPSFMQCPLQTSVTQGCTPQQHGLFLGRWTQATGTHKSGSGLCIIWQGIPSSGYLENALEWDWWALGGYIPLALQPSCPVGRGAAREG